MNRKRSLFGFLFSAAFSHESGVTSRAASNVAARRAARLEPTLPQPGGGNGARTNANRVQPAAATEAERKAKDLRLASIAADRKKANLRNAAQQVRQSVPGKGAGKVIRQQPKLAPVRRDDDPWDEMNGKSELALARNRERARVQSILYCPEAKGRWEMAVFISCHTTLPYGKARAALGAAPMDKPNGQTGYEPFFSANGAGDVEPVHGGNLLPFKRPDS